ncbi:hypothetical protein HMPREF9094_0266 [Fusobacterium animalis ATCC 51191]|uniref:Uncharacterized protein n=1 Tax=Fusobacterium animalis ATCC 51191 TaxID=997347 RepID=F9EK12_9FUSO|nr:hypothetical protein HMPREF9094_0266 [Fusobacterium animalis ATCC 51191]
MKKIEEYCKKITDILFDDQKCSVIFSKIIDYIVAQKEINFNDRKTFERKETTDFFIKKKLSTKKIYRKKLVIYKNTISLYKLLKYFKMFQLDRDNKIIFFCKFSI